MKIIDKINGCIENQESFFSFEYFPPKTPAGVENLYARMDRLAALGPLYCDVTWGAGGSTSELTLELSSNAQKLTGVDTLMHMTCTNMDKSSIDEALEKAKEAGIQNILALRGDPARGAASFEECDKGFSHGVDLVRYIKEKYGDYFCIGVAGYPEGHAESTDKSKDLIYLKEKVDAGAEFVITQLFYDVSKFLTFVQQARDLGINVPIIPGIMPIQNYNGFLRMTSFCETYTPQVIIDALEPIKGDDQAVKDYGVKLGIQMCKELLEAGVPGVHLYTLNLERSCVRILEGLGMIKPKEKSHDREFPWQKPTLEKRASESVRPIYWSNRPQSYIARTNSWDEFPNGRWGHNESPAFGDLNESHYLPHAGATYNSTHAVEARRAMWGAELTSVQEIHDVFVKYVSGNIKELPWCDTPLHLETNTIQSELQQANANGFLTINSQPAVNGALSSDPLFGWGGNGGRVYQKAYVECFVSPQNLKILMENAKRMPSIQYNAVDSKGNTYSSLEGSETSVTAVTWGVFPHKEIQQPTIVDINSFMVWKEEAFKLWEVLWESLYEKSSKSAELLRNIRETYFLVEIVDNDFVHGNIWSIFEMPTQ